MKKYILFLYLLLTAMGLLQAQDAPVVYKTEYRPFNLPAQHYISSYDFADFNGDGKLDVAVAILEETGLKIYLKYSEGDADLKSLGKVDSLPDHIIDLDFVKNPVFIALSDIDNDGDADIYLGEMAGSEIDAFVNIVKNNSTDTELDFTPMAIADLVDEFVLAVPSVLDFNKDGLEDVIVSDFDGKLRVYENQGNFQFNLLGENVLGLNNFKSMVAFATNST